MSVKSATWAPSVAKRIGAAPDLRFTPTRVGQTLHVPCSRGHVVDFPITGALPPEIVAKKMMQKGWTIGNKLVCPKHSRKRKPEREGLVQREDVEVAQVAAANDEPAKPSAPGLAARRAAIEWIVEAFDADKGTYKAGVSDATIAKETGLSESAVAEIRELNFGPIKEPPEIEFARQELNRLEERIATFEKECAATVESWRRDVAAHRERLGVLISKNGWQR